MISSIGSSATSQLLATLLSKLASTSSGSSTTSSQSTTASTVSAFQQAIPGNNGPKPSSSSVSPISGDILEALIALQAQQTGGANATTTNTGSSDPVQQLFSAMDSDGDGQISQSEMESYIEGVGGTQAQADALYASLDQGGSSGVTESDMANAVSQASQWQQAWHGHHHHHGMGSGGQIADTLLQALDTDNDGSVSETEFTNFMTANGVSLTNAQNDFTALDSSGSGSLTSADFAKAWQAYTSQSSGTIMASFLGAMAQTGTSVSA